MHLPLHELYPRRIAFAGQISRKLSIWASAAKYSRVAFSAPHYKALPVQTLPRVIPRFHQSSQLAVVSIMSTECAEAAVSTTSDSHLAEASTSGREAPTLDRECFKQVLNVIALRVPNRKCADMMKAFRGYALDRPRLRCMIQDSSSFEYKLLLLEENIKLEDLPTQLRDHMVSEGVTLASADHTVVLDYNMLSTDAVLKKLLPPGVDVPSSFETIGHIAHLNLRDEQLPYRHVIGAVLLDKNPHLRTVVNKVGSIDNEFRVFQMEVIAGEQRLETEVVQHGSRFRLDFSQVYWNSRLESEHLRLVSCFNPGEVLVDMMAGIGPFAVPAAQRGLTVYANDLNPSSANYLALNARLNRISSPPGLHVFNMDGRAFLRLLCDCPDTPAEQYRAQAQQQEQQQKQQQQEQQPPEKQQQSQSSEQQRPEDVVAAAPPPPKRRKTLAKVAEAADPVPSVPFGFAPPPGGLVFDHVVMNLPASAIEFLDAFSGAFQRTTWEKTQRQLPMVHCYTFKRAAETESDILAKVERYLGGRLEPGSVSVHTVRDVAPNKLMLCISFRVPREVAFQDRT